MTRRLRLLAGDWVSLQDGGRPGHARHGVGRSGPMDLLTHRLAIRLGGVPPPEVGSSTAIEVGPGGATLRVEGGSLDVALAGPGAGMTLDATRIPAPAVVRVAPGATAAVDVGGGWAVLSPIGTIDAPAVLGSTSRHDRSRLGPTLQVGDAVPVRCDRPPVALGSRPPPPPRPGPLLVLPGPQTHLFTSSQRDSLTSRELTVAAAGDRMAQRLDGVRLVPAGGHDIVSDGVVRGAVQIQGDGAPWVLLAEHQPTGGYPKIAVLAAADVCRLVQRPIGGRVRLRWGSVAEARGRWRQAVDDVERSVAAAPTATVDRLLLAELAGAVHVDPSPSGAASGWLSGPR